MEKQLEDYTTQELTYELNKRFAMEAKKMYEMRTAMTKHIRSNMKVYNELADIMGSEDLRDTLKKINDLVYNCININIMIEDGKDFMNAVFNNPEKPDIPVWFKYETEKL